MGMRAPGYNKGCVSARYRMISVYIYLNTNTIRDDTILCY